MNVFNYIMDNKDLAEAQAKYWETKDVYKKCELGGWCASCMYHVTHTESEKTFCEYKRRI